MGGRGIVRRQLASLRLSVILVVVVGYVATGRTAMAGEPGWSRRMVTGYPGDRCAARCGHNCFPGLRRCNGPAPARRRSRHMDLGRRNVGAPARSWKSAGCRPGQRIRPVDETSRHGRRSSDGVPCHGASSGDPNVDVERERLDAAAPCDVTRDGPGVCRIRQCDRATVDVRWTLLAEPGNLAMDGIELGSDCLR